MKAVDIQGVSQRYGSMTVLHDLSLQLAEGEVLGLFGHNGAGKTTTMKLILGLLAPSEGQVRVLGQAPGRDSFDGPNPRRNFAPAPSYPIPEREGRGLDRRDYGGGRREEGRESGPWRGGGRDGYGGNGRRRGR